MKLKKQKELKDYEFEELVDLAAGRLLEDILRGTQLRRAVWLAVEIGVAWRAAQYQADRKGGK